MRVVLGITLAETGGAQSHVAALAAALPAQVELTVVTRGPGPLTERLGGAVAVRFVPDLCREVAPWRDLRALASLRALLGEVRPDLVHWHSSKAGFLGRLAARRLSVPAVYTVHGWAFSNRGSPLRGAPAVWFERVGARAGGEIICVAESDLEAAVALGIAPRSRLHHVPNGLPDLTAAPAPELADLPRPLALWVGRMDPPKDPALAVRAFLAAGAPGALVFAGEGRLRASAEAAAGGDPRVLFLGARGDVPALLAGADLHVLTSRSEALPMTLLEAMRAGTSTLATAVGDLERALSRSGAGWTAPLDAPALAATWRRVTSEREVLAAAGARARSAFLADYTVERMVGRVLEVYELALRRAVAGRRGRG